MELEGGLTELNKSVYRTGGWHTVENLAEDADDDFFSRVLHNENHVLHPLLPERNDHGYELQRRCRERGLFLRQQCQSQFHIQLHKYRPSY